MGGRNFAATRTRRYATCATILALVGAASASRGAEDAKPADLQTEIMQLERALSNDKVEFEKARAEALALERKLHEARRENTRLRTQLDAKLTRLATLREERDVLRGELASSTGAIGNVLRSRFKHAQQEKLKVLLGGDDIATLQRKLKYLDYVANANTALLSSRTASLDRLGDLESALKLEATKLRRERARAERDLGELTASFEVRDRVVKSLESLLKNNADALEQLRRDDGELAALVDEVAEDTAVGRTARTPFAGLKGELAWPTSGPIAKAPGSAMRDGGAKWGGVIIESEPGADVAAVAPGTVAFADWFRNLGLLVIIDHGDGFMSLYGHNRELYKTIGDAVAAGDVVASVGDTGGRSRTGLYFEIRRNGEPEDPRRWCRK